MFHLQIRTDSVKELIEENNNQKKNNIGKEKKGKI